jgi:hypothetical protein
LALKLAATNKVGNGTMGRTTRAGGASRRELVGAAAAAAGLSALPAWARAAAGARQVAGFDPSLVPSPEKLAGWLRQLHGFGPIRATGTPQARAFEEVLATQFAALGFHVQRDHYRLMSWECDIVRDCAITVTEDGKAPKALEVVAYYPFAASTRGKGPVTGRVLYAGVGDAAVKALVARTSPAELAKSIVVVDMPLAGGGARGFPKLFPGTFPDPLPAAYDGPNPASQGGRPSMEAVEDKCQALVLCYTDVSNEAARYNWLPFSDQHRRTPALWIGAEDAKYLAGVSGKASLTLRVDAKTTPDARADTILATLPGPSDEVVFLTTQTDGPNECNENGGLGVLALATYAAKLPPGKRKRTLVCSLPTGHYAFGAVADKVTGSGKPAGTRGVMAEHPEMVKKIVGHMSLEQMAAMEWSAGGMGWAPTGLPAPEMWLPTATDAPAVNRIFHAATAGEDPKYSRSALVESGFAPGEGGAPRAAGLPGIGLMGAPQYFFRADPKGVIDKLNPRVMKNQIDIATKMMVLMDRLSVDQLYGRAPISEADLFG